MTTDDRRAPRYHIDATVFVEAGERTSPSDTGEIVICSSMDLSETGLQVVLDQGIKTGRIVRLCIDIKGRDAIYVVGKVVWHHQQGNLYHHGIMLLPAKIAGRILSVDSIADWASATLEEV